VAELVRSKNRGRNPTEFGLALLSSAPGAASHLALHLVAARVVPSPPSLAFLVGHQSPVPGDRMFFSPGTRHTPGAALAPGVVQFRIEVPASAPRALRGRLTLHPKGASPWTPPPAEHERAGVAVLVSFDRPVLWDGGAPAINVMRVDTRSNFSVDVPEGAKTAFVQVANPNPYPVVYSRLALSTVARK